jgi:hypothetical protein
MPSRERSAIEEREAPNIKTSLAGSITAALTIPNLSRN